MKQQAFNPYLPLSVYIPDGEPHVFGDRVYVYGSHDKEAGQRFCMLDYEVWSAPVDDLSDWSCKGISYDKTLDPDQDENGRYKDMYAPDVVQGNDGRYYLYYALAGGAFTGPIHVAVSDAPDGPFTYHGCVQNADGSPYWRNITFDPGVINDNGTIRLYYGWALAAPQLVTGSKVKQALMRKMMSVVEQKMFDKTKAQIKAEPEGIQGAFTVTLADDMLTVMSEPKRIVPGQVDALGGPYEGHAFFEASSIRKIGDTYYFVYSSEVNHELCYATSKYPDRDFSYRGVIVSNGDIGYQGRKPEERAAMTGNNHGGLVCIKDQWYIFYHRQTHKTCFSRQGCAEPIRVAADGSIAQVPMTSCGLNGGPLVAEGTYPAVIACVLYKGSMPHIDQRQQYSGIPYITNEGETRYIADVVDQTVIGYRYFNYGSDQAEIEISLSTRGGEGRIFVREEEHGKNLGQIQVTSGEDWHENKAHIKMPKAVGGMYLVYEGQSPLDLLEISLHRG